MSGGAQLIVRNIRPEEHTQVSAMLTEAYAAKDISEEYLAEVGKVSERAAAPGAETLVAVSVPDGALLGSCVVADSGSPLMGLARPGEMGLRLLGTAAAARRRGVGRALVSEALARVRQAGRSALVLGTMADMTDAQRLYVSMGFTRMPERDKVMPSGRPLYLYGLGVSPWPEVRPARDDELDAVGELTVAAYAADGHLDTDTAYEDVLRDARGRARDAEILVAVDREDGRLLGSMMVCPNGSRYREVAGPEEAEFRMLSVAPDARGRGVGEAMVRAVLTRAHADGLDGVALYSGDWMPTAHRLYVRLGFHRDPGRDLEGKPGLWLRAFSRPV